MVYLESKTYSDDCQTSTMECFAEIATWNILSSSSKNK